MDLMSKNEVSFEDFAKLSNSVPHPPPTAAATSVTAEKQGSEPGKGEAYDY
jgi:hypothetical protein